MRTIERDIVATVILSRDNRLLLGMHGEHGAYLGCWVIFGGGIDEGENQRTALNREIAEETGIDISKYLTTLVHEATGESDKNLRDTGERVHVKMKFFDYKVVIDDKDHSDIKVTISNEHTEYKWAKISELKDLKISPPSVELFKKLGYL
jgi:8-oxo-dGTP pyrophosphatase MutT (NUDIX family)